MLISKFCLLLNEKKKKIAQLEKIIIGLHAGRDGQSLQLGIPEDSCEESQSQQSSISDLFDSNGKT